MPKGASVKSGLPPTELHGKKSGSEAAYAPPAEKSAVPGERR